jgi:hypothetical protein
MDNARLKEIVLKLMDDKQKSTLVCDHGDYKVMFPYCIMQHLNELEDLYADETSQES